MKKEWIFLLGVFLLLAMVLGPVLVFESPSQLLNYSRLGKTPALPTYPAVNISTTLTVPPGIVRINATVPESFAAMPVYRQNISEMTDIFINREAVVRKFDRNTANDTWIMDLLPSDSEAVGLAEQYLQPYGGVPPDAVVDKIVRSPGIQENFPNMSSPYVRVCYAQSLSGIPVARSADFNARKYDEYHLLEVDIVTDGELIRLEKRWAKTEFIRTDPVMPVEEAMKKIEPGEGHIFMEPWSLNVTKIWQGYRWNTRVSTIPEPVWAFSGTINGIYDLELYVPARRNGSAALPMYSNSYPEKFIPKPPFDNIRTFRASIHDEFIPVSTAMDTVRTFSGNPDLLITNSEYVNVAGKFGGSKRIYVVNTSEGLYSIDARTGKLVSVHYHQTGIQSENTTLTFNSIIEKTGDFIRSKFGNFSPGYLESNVRITESPGHFLVVYPISNHSIGLDIENTSGTILNFFDFSAEYEILPCD
jgi:hypothetical protein